MGIFEGQDPALLICTLLFGFVLGLYFGGGMRPKV